MIGFIYCLVNTWFVVIIILSEPLDPSTDIWTIIHSSSNPTLIMFYLNSFPVFILYFSLYYYYYYLDCVCACSYTTAVHESISSTPTDESFSTTNISSISLDVFRHTPCYLVPTIEKEMEMFDDDGEDIASPPPARRSLQARLLLP